MIGIQFFNKTYRIDSNRIGTLRLELYPEILDVVNGYFSKEENISDKHLCVETITQISKVPFIQRLGYLIQAVEQTIDMSLPESKHAINILHLFNYKLKLSEEIKHKQRKNTTVYPHLLTEKNTNLFLVVDGSITVNYEDGISTTISADNSIPSYGWSPYTEQFRYGVYFNVNTPDKILIQNLKIYDEGTNFNHMDVNVGVMNAKEDENTLSFSSSKESILFVLHGEYEIVSGIEVPDGRELDRTLYEFKFLNGCNFTIRHKGDKPTVVVLLEKREL